MTNNTKTISFEDRERVFWFIVSISLLSLGLYFYAINAVAHHIAIRENLERETTTLSAELGSLEFASIELRNNMTMERALELGFSEVKRPLYVSRVKGTALTFNSIR